MNGSRSSPELVVNECSGLGDLKYGVGYTTPNVRRSSQTKIVFHRQFGAAYKTIPRL